MSAKSTYAGFARFYDAYAGHYSIDLPLYKRLAAQVMKKPVVEAGCGTGRVMLALLQEGVRVTGVDISTEMLNLAQGKLQSYRSSGTCMLMQHNFVDGTLQGCFGLALVTFYTFNYLHPREQKAFLVNLAQCLEPGAKIALHLFYPLCLSSPHLAGRWVDKGTYRIDEEKIHLQDHRIMLDDVTEERVQIYTRRTGKSMRIETLRYYISPTRMAGLLAAAGFTSVLASCGTEMERFTSIDNLTNVAGEFYVIAEKP